MNYIEINLCHINFKSVQERLHLKFHVMFIRTDIKNAVCKDRQLSERNVKILDYLDSSLVHLKEI